MEQRQPRTQHPINKIVQKHIEVKSPLDQEYRGMISYEEIPIPFMRIGVDGSILSWNEPLLALFGCSEPDLAGSSLLDLVDFPSIDLMKEILASTHNSNSSSPPVAPGKVWFKRKDGRAFPAAFCVRPLHDLNGKVTAYNIALMDETVNHDTIEGLKRVREELERKERCKDEFIAVASHELKTPIQPILGFALLAKMGMVSEQKAWDGVLAEARRLQQLSNDILDVSRIESSTLKYHMKVENVDELLEQIADSMRKDVRKDVEIVVAHHDSGAEMEVDRSRMTQVITNIVGNAIKFTDKGTISIGTSVFPAQNKAEIRISDTGKGIAPEIMPKLFEKFATKGHGDTKNNKGSGLGLYVSKAIVRAHGGEISAFNNAHGGATFLITLPISQARTAVTLPAASS